MIYTSNHFLITVGNGFYLLKFSYDLIILQHSELVQEKLLKEDLLQEREAAAKCVEVESESKCGVNYSDFRFFSFSLLF